MIRKILLSTLCLLPLLAHPVMAQQADANDLYDATRTRYMADVKTQEGNIESRQANYLNQIKGSDNFWWGVWEKHQPYSTNIAYGFRPGILDVPSDPSLTSNSGFGRNITALVYGNRKNVNRKANEAVSPDYQPPTSNPGADLLNPRDDNPVQDADVRNALGK